MSRVDRSRLLDLRAALEFRDWLGPDQTQRMLVEVYDGGAIPTDVPRVYLTRPTLVDAGDTEGASPSFTPDTSITIPVVVLGPTVPVAGDHLVAHAIGGRWLAGDGGGSSGPPPAPCKDCYPCVLPESDLEITYVATPGTLTIRLAYQTSGLLAGTWYGEDPGYADGISFECACGTFLIVNGYAGNCFYNANDVTCSPFVAHFPIPPYDSGACYNATAGVSSITIRGPGGTANPCQCTATVNVVGCGGLPVEGASVEVKDSLGTTLDSGTTDASGNFTSTQGFGSGRTIVVSKDRFNTQTLTDQGFYCSDILSVDMSGYVATGYISTTNCADPIATVLHATHPVFGAVELDYDAGGASGEGWYATVTYSYPGCFCCPAETVTVDCFLDVSFNYTESWQST